MKFVTLNEAVSVLLAKGYGYQFDGNWIRINPDKVLVGRAVTVQFMPLRADMLEGNKALTARNGDRFGTNKSNLFPALTAYDVPVVDLFGKGEKGTYVGDNFATQIFANTGTGIVVDGNIIDIEGYREPRISGVRSPMAPDTFSGCDGNEHERADHGRWSARVAG